MKKPWDNGPTPETDAACMAECWPDVVLPTGSVPASFARDLERRLRSAERLLATAAPWVSDECVLRAAIDAQLLWRQVVLWRPWVLLLMAGWYEMRWRQSGDRQFITLADETWCQLDNERKG